MGKDSKTLIKTSNVFKFVFICIVTIIAVLLFRNWYLKGKESFKNVPVLETVLTHQIKPNELYNYVHDANTATVYMCVSSDEICRNLEKDMKNLIQKNGWEDSIIYLDLKDVPSISEFYENLYSHYQYEPKIGEYPTIIYFENATIHRILSGKDITVQQVKEFLKELPLV